MAAARDPWSEAEVLFQRALELEPEAREAFVEREAGGATDVAARALQLLAGHARVGPDFLEPRGAARRPGARIAGFALLVRLGAGGMGEVWEAEQERPRRRVALKLVPARACDERAAARLELEAELMARLSHPHVARIYAAGRAGTGAGAPEEVWFAMELVEEALDLVEHARRRALSRAARTQLLELVARAVQHGHDRGVLHLDLKPANVLVDGSGAPKVIDFGIARAAGALRAAPDNAWAGTPDYLAPERCAQTPPAPDPRCDVYALGVLLHELLLGRRPLELGGLALPEALAALRAGPRLALDALPRDLAAVLARALETDPGRRYASAGELADDLARWRAHEAVAARPRGPAGRALLFARRNRALAAAGLLAFAALTTATLVSLDSAREARAAAERESRARQRAESLAALQQRIFAAARPSRALGRPASVRDLLDDALFELQRAQHNAPDLEAELLGVIGSTYALLGERERAESALARALELAEPLGEPVLCAVLRSDRAEAALRAGELEHAGALLEAALPVLERAGEAQRERLWRARWRAGEVARRRGQTARARELLEALASELDGELDPGLRLNVLDTLGQLAYDARDFARAADLHRNALEGARRLLAPDHPLTAGLENGLANDLFDLGRIDEAGTLWSSALERFERILAPEHPDLATVTGNLAQVHERRREFAEASRLYQRAIELRRRALGADSPALATLYSRFAGLRTVTGDAQGARELLHTAIGIRRAAPAAERDERSLALDLVGLALAERRLGCLDEALAAAQEALALQRRVLEARHPDLAQALTLAGSLRVDRGEAELAEPLLGEALAIRAEKLPGHWLTWNTQSVLGGALAAQGRAGEALPLLESALDGLEAALGSEDFRVREARARLESARLRAPR